MKTLPALLCGLCLATAAISAAAAPRPKVGLVLGGGGARGAAHIGVLETLERLQVPVDCVAGTSFGALVAGAWAAGITPAEMRRAMAGADWNAMFQDNTDYTELAFRQKQLQRRYLPGSEAGIGPDGITYPPGAVSGQRIQLFINQLVRADRGERRIDALKLPLSIVATDLGTGERVVFRDGPLAPAMRASMAVPGLVAPLSLDGRKLVDGGLVDNLPVREVRERCGAEVVIAVNVGSPLLVADQIGSLLSVSAQMVALLTEQNVTRSLATLGPRDIYIKPVLDGITAADFARFATSAQRGAEAADFIAYALQPLAVDEAAWRPWLYALRGEREDSAPVDLVRIEGLARVAPETVQRHVTQATDTPLDTETLNRDLLRAYGDGWYEQVNYALVSTHRRQVLRLLPVEKPWGPDYLRFALNLDSTLNQGSTFGLRAALHRTWLNRLGGELLVGAEIGGRTALDAQWYQPLEPTQRWFAQLDAGISSEPRDLYVDERRIARFDVERRTLTLSAGVDLRSLGQLRLGLQGVDGRVHEDVGPELFDPAQLRRRSSGTLLALELDQLNRLYFPTDGWALRAHWFRDHGGQYTRLSADLRANVSVGAWVFGARAAYTGSTQGDLPLFEAGTLGGFLNLSAYATGQLVADTVHYGHVRAERIVGRLPLGLRGDMRLGLALEGGRLSNPYTVSLAPGNLTSVTLYLGGETPFGPVYIGVGHSAAGANNAYLFLGTP
ncbi:patatin-like phospholipase family protein [Rubrivivax albus]|uniref:Patatin n=1 Tax=Rubrivivax albus TaxID=2499835 RepID=A0A437JZ49_9BURK|nr:patatin-like phospholipase family protein [Rubrivivax albus]RVT53377.1 patatin [Rubrivivax albus]